MSDSQRQIMIWFALANWVFVAFLALGAARTHLVSLGSQAMLVLAGLGAMIVLAAGGARAWAFIAAGLAAAAGVFGTVAAQTLIDDAARYRAAARRVQNGDGSRARGVGAAIPTHRGSAVGLGRLLLRRAPRFRQPRAAAQWLVCR